MKLFLFALKEYLRDCYHDHLIDKASKLGCKLCDKVTVFDSKNKYKITKWSNAFTWKEGNLWYYYKQCKIAAKYKKEKKDENI